METTETICRLCLKPSSVSVYIFSGVIPTIIESLTTIKVSKDDGFPANSCQRCISDLFTANEIKNRIIESDNVLKSDSSRFLGDVEIKAETDNDLNSDYHNGDQDIDMQETLLVTEYSDCTDELTEQYRLEGEPSDDRQYKLESAECDEQSDNCAEEQMASEKIAVEEDMDQQDNSVGDSKENEEAMSENVELEDENFNDLDTSDNFEENDKYPTTRDNLSSDDDSSNKIEEIILLEDDDDDTEDTLDVILSSVNKMPDSQESLEDRDYEILTVPSEIIEKVGGKVPPEYFCKICEMKIENERVYLHRNKHMKAKCKICGIVVRSDNVRKHVLAHKSGPQVCDICGSLHKSIEGLRSHLFNFHRKRSNYKCDQCNEEFRLNSKLWDHKRRVHTGVRPYQCESCEKAFFSSHTLKRHKNLVHLNLRAYQCEFCKRGYSSRYALKTHRRQHTGELPYICEHCFEGFRQLVSLRTHMKSKHNIIMKPNKPGHTYSQQAKREREQEERDREMNESRG